MKKEDNEPKRVVGIKYKKEKGEIPRVIVKGSGAQADKIIEKGRKLSPKKVIQDEQLLRQVYKLPVDAEIGRELFELVAILLIHIYSIDEKNGE